MLIFFHRVYLLSAHQRKRRNVHTFRVETHIPSIKMIFSLTNSWRVLRSFVTICGCGPYMRQGSSSYSSSLSSLPAPFAALFSAAISRSICLSICTSNGASMPNLAPRRATSSRHNITCRSFLRIIRSSVSKSRHSMMPRLLRHQSMKFETLSRAKKVPALAFGR